MKLIIKITIGLIFSPFLLLALIIGLLRVLFAITIMFAWNTSDDVYSFCFTNIDKLLKHIKK